MQILAFGPDKATPITGYASSGASSVPLGDGTGEAHVYAVHFEAGGQIGEHPTGFGQLFIVTSGAGWVRDDTGRRHEVCAGQAAYFPCGALHAKGSDEGMTAIMVQVSDLAPPP